MKVAVLGAGTWGYALASLLASKNYNVWIWSYRPEQVEELQRSREHPKLPGFPLPSNVTITGSLKDALDHADLCMEAVTSSGIRPVFQKIKECGVPACPIVVTSKGIERDTGLLLAEVVLEVLGPQYKEQVGCLSGPSHAEELVKGLPTSVVAAAYSHETMMAIAETFTTPRFRVYPNSDMQGVMFGGAMKNIIAIACGISDGLGYGDNTKAILMTRGLHEIRKLAAAKGADPETLNGLAGMGDLCVTCLSTLSRNYRFGNLIAEGKSPDEAKKAIGMAVEGAYSCLSAMQIAEKSHVPLPITETVYSILHDGLRPKEAVQQLMQRPIKEEHL